MNWYLHVLQNYAVFTGRAHRTEYWMFVLVNLIIQVVLMFMDVAFGTVTFAGYGALMFLYGLVLLLPTIGVCIRRLHDTGRSGFWLLLGFIPVINLVLIYFFVLESDPGDNQYGPRPRT